MSIRAIELSEKKTRNGRSPNALSLLSCRRKISRKRNSAGSRIRKNHIKEQKTWCRKTAANRPLCIGHFSFWQQYISVCFTEAQPEPQIFVLWGLGKHSSTSKTASGYEDNACRFANLINLVSLPFKIKSSHIATFYGFFGIGPIVEVTRRNCIVINHGQNVVAIIRLHS